MQTRRILCGLDFSDSSRAVLRIAAQLARERAAVLIVAHVTEYPMWAREPYTQLPNEIMQDLLAGEKRTLEQWKRDAEQLGVPEVVTKHATGTAWSELVAIAEADPAIELVVVATHGRTGLQRALIGSVAERVVRHAPCNVLVVRSQR
jgi:nucleotide-binding universal stress UspA family protein